MQMNDWIRHTFTQYYIKYYTQYYIKYINIAMLANFQHKPLKLAALIAVQERNLWLKKFIFMATHYFPVHTHLFQYVSGFQLEKNWTRSKLEPTYFYACWIIHIRHNWQIFPIFWWKLTDISCVNTFDLDLVEFMTSSLGNLHILNFWISLKRKEIFENSKPHHRKLRHSTTKEIAKETNIFIKTEFETYKLLRPLVLRNVPSVIDNILFHWRSLCKSL